MHRGHLVAHDVRHTVKAVEQVASVPHHPAICNLRLPVHEGAVEEEDLACVWDLEDLRQQRREGQTLVLYLAQRVLWHVLEEAMETCPH